MPGFDVLDFVILNLRFHLFFEFFGRTCALLLRFWITAVSVEVRLELTTPSAFVAAIPRSQLKSCRACPDRKFVGVPYSQFMDGVQRSNIALNRKMLAELAVTEPYSFQSLVSEVKKVLPIAVI